MCKNTLINNKKLIKYNINLSYLIKKGPFKK